MALNKLIISQHEEMRCDDSLYASFNILSGYYLCGLSVQTFNFIEK